MRLAQVTADKRKEEAALYDRLEDRILARDQVEASETYYELLRGGRPLTEIMAEAIRIHAPYTARPLSRADRRRVPEIRQ